MQLPELETRTGDANHRSHTLGPCSESGMAKESAHILSSLHRTHRKPYQTVMGMTEVPIVEAEVAGEEGRLSLLVQERDDLLVQDSLPGDIVSDLPRPNPPAG